MDLENLKENSKFKGCWSFILIVITIVIVRFFKEFIVLAGIVAIAVIMKN